MRREPARVVIVGASLTGLRAGQALREQGFSGSLTIIGAEPHLPYDRPPLTKQFLTSAEPVDLALPGAEDIGAEWVLGRPAVRLTPTERTVTVADGHVVAYDALLIATGAAAQSLPGHRKPPVGVMTIRNVENGQQARSRLETGAPVAVIGAGFLGSEVAASAVSQGVSVTLVEAEDQPLARVAGAAAGRFIAELHRQSGIDLRTATTVTGFEADARDRLTHVLLSDRSRVRAETALLALGARPATEWLTGSGVDISRGVRCDEHLRALTPEGTVIPSVFAAGDVARVPHPLAGGQPLLLGHWTHANEQGTAAARTILGAQPLQPFKSVPTFWSDLHGIRLRSVGLPQLADDALVLEQDLDSRRLEVTYRHDGQLIGALTIGRTNRLARHRQDLLRAPAMLDPQ